MRAWRITAALHAETAFSGEGAIRHSARWHNRGTAIVYTSSTLPLAALETLVNLAPADENNRGRSR
jgi:RES domain-containing protein